MKKLKLWEIFFLIGIVAVYAAAIICDIIYMNTEAFALKIAYWTLVFLGHGACLAVCIKKVIEVKNNNFN